MVEQEAAAQSAAPAVFATETDWGEADAAVTSPRCPCTPQTPTDEHETQAPRCTTHALDESGTEKPRQVVLARWDAGALQRMQM